MASNEGEAGAHLDRMALISRLLLHPRLLHLRQEFEQLKEENEALKLTLFWKDHCRSKLQELMVACNLNGPQCTCLSCAVSGRMDEEQRSMPWGTRCTFKDWFEQELDKHGLTAVTGVHSTDQKPLPSPMACDEGNTVYDVDAHFHHLTRDDWFMWQYGAKLWKAQRVTDPELQKLSALFQSLSAAACDE
jgi:hypothetical protein